MHEIQLLLSVCVAIFFSFFIAWKTYAKKVRNKEMDSLDAVKRGLFLALGVFILLIVVFENTRVKKQAPDNNEKWCEEHPSDCRSGIPLIK